MSDERVSYGTVSVIRQGDHEFFSFTMPSDVLGECSFVVDREEDPQEGFQRELDEKRAKEIAKYIDQGLGTIPTAIILSAQDECDFEHVKRSKTINFKKIKKAFLIIDGQHRVYGFKLAKSKLRIPVVVYTNLSKKDETRLFIDINSKQKGVPTELLLDIKKMAEYENDTEEYLRSLFDIFKDSYGPLYNKLSAAKRIKGKITRSVFNTSLKPLVKLFSSKSPDEVFEIYNAYLEAFQRSILDPNDLKEELYSTTMFKAVAGFFPTVTARVKDRYGSEYTINNYYEFLKDVGTKVKVSKLKTNSSAYKPIVDHLEESLKSEFSL